MEKITSRQNEKIRQVAFLKKRSERESAELFFFEGVHLLEEYLRFGHTPEYVFATGDAISRSPALIERCGNAVYEVADSVYEKMTDEKAPQGILCVSRFLDSVRHGTPVKGSIILESLQDNGNVGTVIRTAASLGTRGIAMSADCADIYAAKTVRATMGALFSVGITVVSDIPEVIRTMRADGGRIFAAILDENAKRLDKTEIRSDDSFVIGNEGNGVSRMTADACDGGVYIPMSGRTESLNASAAAAIILWEMKRSGNG